MLEYYNFLNIYKIFEGVYDWIIWIFFFGYFKIKVKYYKCKRNNNFTRAMACVIWTPYIYWEICRSTVASACFRHPISTLSNSNLGFSPNPTFLSLQPLISARIYSLSLSLKVQWDKQAMRKGAKRKTTHKGESRKKPSAEEQINEPSQSPSQPAEENHLEERTEDAEPGPSKKAAAKGGRKRAKISKPETEPEYFPEQRNLVISLFLPHYYKHWRISHAFVYSVYTEFFYRFHFYGGFGAKDLKLRHFRLSTTMMKGDVKVIGNYPNQSNEFVIMDLKSFAP